MKTKKTRRPSIETTVQLQDLRLTQKQLDTLKKGFTILLVATLATTGKVTKTGPQHRLVVVRRRAPGSSKTAKKTRTP